MSDTISRQAAITNYQRVCREIACNDCPFLIHVTDTLTDCRLERFLHDLPSAQPEPHWIPCSERLPYPWDEKYLVSLAWGGIGVMEYKSTGFHNYGSFTPVPIESITAWMPLPEPYNPT